MSRGRLFGSLCGLVFLVNLARVVFAPLLSELIVVFNIGEGTAGTIATLVWVGSALPRIPVGWLLTRVPRHRVVLATGCVLSGAALVAAASNSVLTLAAGALLMGLSTGAYFVAANPLVSELFPERVGRMMGIHGVSAQLAAVLAAPIVTLAVRVDWRLTFLAVAVGAAVSAVSIYWAARRADLPEAGRADRDFLGAARAEWRVVVLGIVILGTTGFVWQGLFNFFELYLVATKGVPATTAKNALTVIFAAGVPAFYVSGRLVDRLPHLPYLLSVLGAFVVCVLAIVASSGLAALLVLSAVVGFVIHSLFPALDTYLLSALPDENRASAYAVYSGGMMLTQATGASVVGTLVEAGVAYDAVFGGLAVGLAAVVAALVVLYRLDRLPE